MLKLMQPHGDKNWCVEGHVNKDQHDKMLKLFHKMNIVERSVMPTTNDVTIFKDAKPFFQGGSRFEAAPQWVMVEFWTDNQSKILSAAESMANILETELQ